jgi:23S rRNA (cytosine1962-C5)-methyltransferase
MAMESYELIDSGHGRKLELFGPYLLIRPCAQAVWAPSLPAKKWRQAAAEFSRDEGWSAPLPESWEISLDGLTFKLSATDFGHVGLFPEHRQVWAWLKKTLSKGERLLNLFAYSGGATLAAAQAGAEVCHLDSSKGMVAWARENAALNGLSSAPIRWIVDDAMKFLRREVRRGRTYECILLDPPSFGRGSRGEVFKIDEAIEELLRLCKELLSPRAKGLLLTCHTPGYTPLTLNHLLEQAIKEPVATGEMRLEGARAIPAGAYARWEAT